MGHRRDRTQPTAEPDRAAQYAQPQPARVVGESAITCARCRGFYLDDDDGRRAHQVVFGHTPSKEVAG